jgi:hypothetical protein
MVRLRSYAGETKIEHGDDGGLEIVMSGVARMDRAKSYATRFVRDIMLGAMRDQMQTSLADLSKHIVSNAL